MSTFNLFDSSPTEKTIYSNITDMPELDYTSFINDVDQKKLESDFDYLKNQLNYYKKDYLYRHPEITEDEMKSRIDNSLLFPWQTYKNFKVDLDGEYIHDSDDDTKSIYVNSGLPKENQNSTLWHEYNHYMYDLNGGISRRKKRLLRRAFGRAYTGDKETNKYNELQSAMADARGYISYNTKNSYGLDLDNIINNKELENKNFVMDAINQTNYIDTDRFYRNNGKLRNFRYNRARRALLKV